VFSSIRAGGKLLEGEADTVAGVLGTSMAMAGTEDLARSTRERCKRARSDAVTRNDFAAQGFVRRRDHQVEALPGLSGDPVYSWAAAYLDVIVGLSNGCTVVRM
jgi:hypothetical protein